MKKFLSKFIRVDFDLETGKSVQTITASLQNTVKDLEAHAVTQRLRRDKKLEQARRLAFEAGSHGVEADKASAVAGKVGALLS